ncbi:hypothetical protein O3G_MSEX010207 [Manduca sexta]|uniref:Uncharacterized protein n=1 Tax=Manduca sexta TaxID=7130 RepID=A0A921ZH51_MANSE|nr:hypothetical protein O3G_MSEX010207 [Manduca sexta]
MALYDCPMWAEYQNARCAALLRKLQRLLAQRIVTSYRTVCHEGTCVLAGSLSWEKDHFHQWDLSSEFFCREKAFCVGRILGPREITAQLASIRSVAMKKWHTRMESPSADLRTVATVRSVKLA